MPRQRGEDKEQGQGSPLELGCVNALLQVPFLPNAFRSSFSKHFLGATMCTVYLALDDTWFLTSKGWQCSG